MSTGSIISEISLKNINNQFASANTAQNIATIIDKATSNGTKNYDEMGIEICLMNGERVVQPYPNSTVIEHGCR